MASNTFENFNVLIVEDQMHIRSLLASVVQSYGFGRTITAASYSEAVEILTSVGTSPGKVGVTGIDIVLLDKVLLNDEEKSGIDLSHWIRNSQNSPDQFMRILMISAFFDASNLKEAPDVGVHSCLVKPFTARSIYRHLYGVIHDRRQFVKTDTYFGPDRRRRDEPRENQDERRASVPPSSVKFYRAKDIRSKLFGEPPEEAEEDLLNELDRKLEESNEVVQEEMATLVKRFTQAHQDLSEAMEQGLEDEVWDERVDVFRESLFNLRGASGVFTYPMVVRLGQYIDRMCATNDVFKIEGGPRLVKLLVDTIHLVHLRDIRGYGGQVGVQIIEKTELALRQFQQKLRGERNDSSLSIEKAITKVEPL